MAVAGDAVQSVASEPNLNPKLSPSGTSTVFVSIISHAPQGTICFSLPPAGKVELAAKLSATCQSTMVDETPDPVPPENSQIV